MNRKIYGKIIRNGWIVAAVGVVLIVSGINLAEIRGNMDYYSLVMLGLLVSITGIAVAAIYSRLEKSVSHIVNSISPLLRYTLAAEDYGSLAESEADEIREANKASLYIGLFFCALIAIGGPILVRETGYYFTLIAIGIALFLIVSQWAITKYRVNKLKKSDREVILTAEGAYVWGQFHVWSMPLTSLNKAQYFKPGEYIGCSTAVIRITYSSISGTIVTPYTFIIPVPPGLEEQAEMAARSLKTAIG